MPSQDYATTFEIEVSLSFNHANRVCRRIALVRADSLDAVGQLESIEALSWVGVPQPSAANLWGAAFATDESTTNWHRVDTGAPPNHLRYRLAYADPVHKSARFRHRAWRSSLGSGVSHYVVIYANVGLGPLVKVAEHVPVTGAGSNTTSVLLDMNLWN